MKQVTVKLQPLIHNINLTTVIKTVILPGEQTERVMIATQLGEIYSLKGNLIELFLDIQPLILTLGASSGGYDERGLLGLAFHPDFRSNGLFYLHYTMTGTQGPGALTRPFQPNPCDPATLNLQWLDRENLYDHIDTVEEWIYQRNGQSQKLRTLLTLRRPFLNHNGVNTLNFSPETGNLVLTTGDGGSGFDPFNLAQDYMEIAGKIIEIDVSMNVNESPMPVVTRFNELPMSIQNSLTVIAKGVRNITGITYQKFSNQYMKYVGMVGQDLVESIFSFGFYQPISVPQITQSDALTSYSDQEGLINLGWRGWEGIFPTAIIDDCSNNQYLEERIFAYYDEAIETSVQRIHPLISYFHHDPRLDKFDGTAITGVQVYLGTDIPDLTGTVIFTDFVRGGDENITPPVKGVLAYTKEKFSCHENDFSVIDIDYNFGSQSAYFTCLGTNQEQSKLYLAVYGSNRVTDLNQGTIFEIMP